MEIVRSFAALLAGFGTMVLLIALITFALMRRSTAWIGPPGHPAPAFVAVSMAYSFLAAAAGGFVTAWVALNRPLHTVLTLAIVVLAFGAITALQARGSRPTWYQIALLVASALGVMAGGLLRLHFAGLP